MDDDDLEAFTRFVNLSYRRLARSAYLLVGDRGHAEDLVQVALLKTAAAWSRLQATEAAESYARTTMVREAGRWGRRRWRGEVPHFLGVSEHSDQALPHQASVDSADSTALALDVRLALSRLPWTQRSALVLRYFDDLSEADTARALNCSPGTVKSRVSRGLAKLRADGVLTDSPRSDVPAPAELVPTPAPVNSEALDG